MGEVLVKIISAVSQCLLGGFVSKQALGDDAVLSYLSVNNLLNISLYYLEFVSNWTFLSFLRYHLCLEFD